MGDLPTLHINTYDDSIPSGTWIPLGKGDQFDVETGRCCPSCRHNLTSHNKAVYAAAWSMYRRHDGLDQSEAPDWFVTAVTDEARLMSSTPQSVAQAAWNALLRASVAPPSA